MTIDEAMRAVKLFRTCVWMTPLELQNLTEAASILADRVESDRRVREAADAVVRSVVDDDGPFSVWNASVLKAIQDLCAALGASMADTQPKEGAR